MNLKGKVCLVTGGTSGIGVATARALADRGARVAVVSRHAEAVANESPTAFDREFLYLQGNVADPEECRRSVDAVSKKFGHVDVLVHAAGGPASGDLFSTSETDWMDAFAVHVHAVYHLAKAVAPCMIARNEGAIILIGSAAGLRGCLGALPYGVVKGALPQFARNLARELAPHNIRVNCVSPGIIRTPFHAGMSAAQVENNIENRIPLRREGTPEDVAAMIVSLVENEFITGENIVMDGGMTMRIV